MAMLMFIVMCARPLFENMNIKYVNPYNKLIARKKVYFVFVLATPVVIGALSISLGEIVAFILAGIYGAIFVGWSLFLYFLMCPNCYGLFYGSSFKVEKTIGHKFFLNNECNNCGFKPSEDT